MNGYVVSSLFVFDQGFNTVLINPDFLTLPCLKKTFNAMPYFWTTTKVLTSVLDNVDDIGPLYFTDIFLYGMVSLG